MTIIVNDDGFGADNWSEEHSDRQIFSLESLLAGEAGDQNKLVGVDLPPDASVNELVQHFENLALVSVQFNSFADGRGFSLARQLRQKGYKGVLRATGHVLADQYAMARKSGFDEVAIDKALSERQPVDQWMYRVPKEETYQGRLGQG
ncbi:MAG: DUF934 domain-containing protein [Rhizobiaceae bacterium]